MYEGMYNGHSYLIEQDRLYAGTPANGPVRPVQADSTQEDTWQYVKGHDGCIVHTNAGLLMVNNHGQYAQEVDYRHLLNITGHEVQQARVRHEVQQARVRHELKDFMPKA